MRNTAHFKMLLYIMICLFLLSSCDEPIVGKVLEEDINKYLNVNSFVEKKLFEEFKGSLPTKEIIDNNSKYYYYYECGLIGEPRFVIYLKTTIKQQLFTAEIDRIKSICLDCIGTPRGDLYVIQDFSFGLNNYLDNRIHDGMYYYFELVLINEDNNTIEYLTSLFQDNAGKNYIIDSFIDLLIEKD